MGLCSSRWVLITKKLDQIAFLVLKFADPWSNTLQTQILLAAFVKYCFGTSGVIVN